MPPLSPSDLSLNIDYEFKDISLLNLALLHSSLSRSQKKNKNPQNNERLEFLGDRVLGLIVAEMVYAHFPMDAEGSLAKRHASLVRKETLARVAHSLDLGQAINMIQAEERTGGRENDAILANTCEALIAAIYLDGGLEAAERFIKTHWSDLMAEDITPPQDAKTTLQEWVQAKGLPLPVYEMISRTGPDHAPVFEIEVHVEGFQSCQASGASKRKAEQQAAEIFLAQHRDQS